MKRTMIILLLFLSAGLYNLAAQETAEKFFDRVSEYYGSVTDYEGDLIITRGDLVQKARISYKTPNMLRLDFTEPEGQVMVVNNEKLELYLPEYRVSFVQPIGNHSDSALANMANAQGLALMKTNYSIGYVSGPAPVPLEAGSQDIVTKLKLNWRSTSEGFRELTLSVGSNNLIRRVEGLTTGMEKIVFDFVNLEINKGIPDARFDYKSPPEGNTIENFLFEPEG